MAQPVKMPAMQDRHFELQNPVKDRFSRAHLYPQHSQKDGQ